MPQTAHVPTVAHGIDVVLKGDGLYPLEAPWLLPRHRPARRLFSDSLRQIVQPDQIAWNEIPPYIPASEDSALHDVAQRTNNISFCSSTSSITPTLSLLYHVISNFKDTGLFGGLSAQIRDMPATFSKMHRRPIAVTIKKVHNEEKNEKPLYSISAHSGKDRGPSILRDLGHSMERMLTTPPNEFDKKYVLSQLDGKSSSPSPNFEIPTPSIENQNTEQQFYNYTQVSNMVLRAQIDCMNESNGELFDVKTRAVAPIRYDLLNYGAFTSHRLRFLQGRIDSYEREFYDMVRSVFLKYALQLRIGRMSGALVAYHNTREVLGIEYIRLSEIENYVFGTKRWADVSFATSVKLFENILNNVVNSMAPRNDDEYVKVVLYNEWAQLRMFIFAQRVTKSATNNSGDSGDPLSWSHFERLSKNDNDDTNTSNSPAEGIEQFLGHPVWHLDSMVHQRKRGIAFVGSHPHLQTLGGERINTDASTVPSRRRPWGANLTENVRKQLNFKSLLEQDALRVWELNVSPSVNGKASSSRGEGVHLDEGDEFNLSHELKQVEDIREEHLSKFTLALGSIYLK